MGTETALGTSCKAHLRGLFRRQATYDTGLRSIQEAEQEAGTPATELRQGLEHPPTPELKWSSWARGQRVWVEGTGQAGQEN